MSVTKRISLAAEMTLRRCVAASVTRIAVDDIGMLPHGTSPTGRRATSWEIARDVAHCRG